MPKGGKREGAGRKPGKRSQETVQRQKAIEASGLTPLDYLLSVLRDEDLPMKSRFEAATAAAPYCHAKLASVAHTGENGGPITVVTRIELVAPEHDDSSS